MHSVDVRLSISADEVLRWYRRQAHMVQCQATDGRNVQFPAQVIQPFVQRNGVSGLFRIYFQDSGKFDRIERL